jgi:hypothetical protein
LVVVGCDGCLREAILVSRAEKIVSSGSGGEDFIIVWLQLVRTGTVATIMNLEGMMSMDGAKYLLSQERRILFRWA